MSGPKYQSGKDGRDPDWEYAGEPEFGFTTWKEHGNDKGSNWTGKSEFEYQDETPESISKDREFPENGYQELPEKM
jgi:hypothetical protein